MVLLTIGELKRFIAYLPDDAVVVVTGDVVNGVKVVNGRIADGHYNPIFNEAAKGKVKALKFTKRTERSDGSVVNDHVI